MGTEPGVSPRPERRWLPSSSARTALLAAANGLALLAKCAACSDQQRAFRLMSTLGIDVEKEANKAGVALPVD